jgi:hypothetical protein
MFPTKSVHETPRCCVCFVKVRLGRTFGRCPSCMRGLSPIYRGQLEAMSFSERQAEYDRTANCHDRPKWTWEGDEESLIAADERRVQEEKENG